MPALRCGVILDAATVDAWQAATIEHLQRSSDAELALVVIMAGRPSPGDRHRRRGSFRRSPTLPLAGAILDFFGARLSRSSALQPPKSTPWSEAVPVIHASPVSGEAVRPEDTEAIKEYRLDFLLDLGSGTPSGDMLRAARSGVWKFQHGDGPRDPGRFPGFWEVHDRRPVGAVTLGRVGGQPGSWSTLRRGWFAIAPGSYARTRDRLLLGPAAWPAQVCHSIRLEASDGDGPASTLGVGPPREPGLGAVLRFLAVLAGAQARALWHHGWRHDDWNVGVIDLPVASLLDRRSIPPVAWAPGRQGHYAADPFGAWDGTTLDVLYEDFARGRGDASIAHRQWDRAHGWGAPRSALDIGRHLSYPCVFEHGGRLLMLPESRASGSLVLYESGTIDGPWTPHATIDAVGDVADATIVEHDGRWWLFAVRADRLNPATELLLWFADRPEGPWRAHPLNPVVVDVRSARPGGPLFRIDGRLYRPAQDCSTGYGDRLAVNRVITLTTERFEEETVCVLEPEPGGPFSSGVHTLTAVGDVTLVDGKRWAWDPATTIRAVLRRLRG